MHCIPRGRIVLSANLAGISFYGGGIMTAMKYSSGYYSNSGFYTVIASIQIS